MRDVVIIGGGLSGLAAAAELESLKIPYRLIEVKPRLGGSIATLRRDGYTVDTGAFAFLPTSDWSFLPELGLDDALIEVSTVQGIRMVAFRDGTQTVIDALATRLKTGTLIHRMAVSSLGFWEGRYTLCMENGLVLDAAALIVAAPARHVERMFRTLTPELSLRLFDYHYDTITRLALGYPGEVPDPGRRVWGDMAIPFYYTTDHPSRVPPGHTLVQMGVRFPLERTTPEDLVRTIQQQFGWPTDSAHCNISVWPEADPLPPHTAHFQQHMAELQGFLPEGVALIGSDYDGLSLSDRIRAGRAAAHETAAFLKAP